MSRDSGYLRAHYVPSVRHSLASGSLLLQHASAGRASISEWFEKSKSHKTCDVRTAYGRSRNAVVQSDHKIS